MDQNSLLKLIADLDIMATPALSLMEWATITGSLRAYIEGARNAGLTNEEAQYMDALEITVNSLDHAIQSDIKRRHNQCPTQ